MGAVVNAIDSVGHGPLHRAAMKGHLEMTRLLLTNEANTDLRDSAGNTPLHLACEDDNGEVARLLMDSGSNFELKNNEKKTAFELAPRVLRRNLESGNQ